MKSIVYKCFLFQFLVSTVQAQGVENRGTRTQKMHIKAETKELHEIEFDYSLIHQLSVMPSDNEIHQAPLPYLAVYKHQDKKLIYLVTPHGSDTESKTHKKIFELMTSKNAPQASIVEIPTHAPKLLETYLRSCDMEKRCVEAPYAYVLAKKHGIKVTGGEPANGLVVQNSIEAGLTMDEIIFFYVVRNFSQWHPNPPKPQHTPENPIQEIKNIIRVKKEILGQSSSPFNLQSLAQIYEKGMGKRFNYLDIKYQDIAPYRDGHYIQKLSNIIDKTREENILKTVEDSLKENSFVFIVYGSGHYLKHKPVLDNALGKPIIIKL